MVRDAAHRHALAGGQRKAQLGAGGPGVVEEKFVEVAQAEKKQGVRIGALERLVLLHQRGFRGFNLCHKGAFAGFYFVYCIKSSSASLRVLSRMKALRAPEAPGRPLSQ